MSQYYDPSRMVIAGVNVDHQKMVELAEKHFVNAKTTWTPSGVPSPDKSVAQFTGGVVKVRACIYHQYCQHPLSSPLLSQLPTSLLSPSSPPLLVPSI